MPRLLYRLIPALHLLVLTACSTPSDRVRITGEIEGVKQAEFYVYSNDEAQPFLDTVRIVDGSFTYERALRAPAVLTLLYPNFSQTLLVAEPGRHIKMTGSAAKLGEASITGSDENVLLTEFRLENANKRPAEARLAADNFVRAHPATQAAIAVFLRFFAAPAASGSGGSANEGRALLEVLHQAQPDNSNLTRLAARISSQMQSSVGQPLPALRLPRAGGGTYLSHERGGHTALYVAVAAWSRESLEQWRAVSRLRATYGDRLHVVAVSLDENGAAARRTLGADSTAVPCVVDGRDLRGACARALGFTALPANVLVSRRGIIVARDVPTDKLATTLAEALR